MTNIFGNSTQGSRDYQEDFFTVVRQNESDITSDILIVVSDGMGGHVGGDIASKTATKAFQASFLASSSANPSLRLQNALKVADKTIAERIAMDPALKGMGCTLIGAIKLHNAISWISVGDSHIFLFRNNNLKKINADHSMMGELMVLVERGEITIEEAHQNPKRNALRSALVGRTIPLVEERSMALREGDIILFATDGIDTIPMSDLQDLVRRHQSDLPEEMSQKILAKVIDIGKLNQDNTTVVTCYHSQSARPSWGENSRWTLTANRPFWRAKVVPSLIAGVVLIVLLGIFNFSGMLDLEPTKPSPIAVEIGAEQSKEILGSRSENSDISDDPSLNAPDAVDLELVEPGGPVPDADGTLTEPEFEEPDISDAEKDRSTSLDSIAPVEQTDGSGN